MASTATTTLRMELMATGENDTTWGTKINNNFEIMESAVSGTTAISTTGGTTTLTNVDYTNDQAKKAVLDVSGALVSNATIVIPNASKVYRVLNRTSGAYTLSIKTSSGSAIVITQSTGAEVYCDGSNTMRFVTPLTDFTTGAPSTSSGAAASSVSVTATALSGTYNISSANVQSALAELQGDINTLDTAIAAKQPLNADLTALASVTTAAYGRGLLAYSSEATLKAALSLGTSDTPVFAGIVADGAAGVIKSLNFDTAGLNRWLIYSSSTAESGSNVGSDFTINRYSDAGTNLGAALSITRSTGITNIVEAALTTDLAVTHGGTGASTAADARTNLGLVIGTNVQAYDAELAAIAGLTSAADRLPYFTGSSTASLATFTAAGRAILDDADASAQRTTLGLAIGTDVQAYNAGLAAVSGVTTAAYGVNLLTYASEALFKAGVNLEANTDFYAPSGTDVAVADGGTGSSTAAGARTNLGVTATGSDTTYNYRANNLSDVASAATAFTNIKQNASTTATGVVELATAAEMEAETAGKVPTADIVKNSPGVAKFFLCATVSAGTPSITDSYNMTSITDTGTGSITGTIATDFAGANWAATLSIENDASNLARFYYILNGGYTAGTFVTQAHNVSDGSFRDPAKWFVTGHGDQ